MPYRKHMAPIATSVYCHCAVLICTEILACRAWYDGRVSGTISKARQIDIDYDDGEEWKNKGWRGMVWRLVRFRLRAQC